MKKYLMSVLALLLAAPGNAQDRNQLQVFLGAADENDFPTMRSVMTPKALEEGRGEISLDRFFEKIEGCYLRRVYSTPDQGRLLAAWMCAEGDKRSRVVTGDIWSTEDGVQVGISMEQRNNRPAPERTGSAFGDED